MCRGRAGPSEKAKERDHRPIDSCHKPSPENNMPGERGFWGRRKSLSSDRARRKVAASNSWRRAKTPRNHEQDELTNATPA